MIQENVERKNEAVVDAYAFADLPEDDDFEEFDFGGRFIRRRKSGR